MREAIAVAQQSEENGGPAIGAVIVKDGLTIARGMSTVWPERNPNGHGETNCIRAACKALDSLDLSGCIMYGTLEPCGMCVSCAAWANLSELYFGAYRTDVPGNEYEQYDWSAEMAGQRMRLSDNQLMHVTGGVLRKECAGLMRGYVNWSRVNSD